MTRYFCPTFGVKPVRIKIFVNRPDLAPDGYAAFMQKQLRGAFDLVGIPLVLDFVARPKKVESIRRKEFVPVRRSENTKNRRMRPGRRGYGKRS